jgi:hypothetical protein
MSRAGRILQGFCLRAIGVLLGRWTGAIDTVSAQVPSNKGAREILIGNAPIHLGDLEESTLGALRKLYEVSDRGEVRYATGKAEVFVIEAKEPPSILGNLMVIRGR